MRRHHYLDARTRWLTDPGILAKLRVMHRRLAAEQARSLGLLDSDGPGSWTHPTCRECCTPTAKSSHRCSVRSPVILGSTRRLVNCARCVPGLMLDCTLRGPARQRGARSGCW